MKTLIIVESPAKASKISEFLSNEVDEYTVLASCGHVTELAKGGHHGIGIDIVNNFKPHYVLSQTRIEIVDNIMKTAKICDNILLGCDDDREGHSIAYFLKNILEDFGKPIQRIVFGEIKKDKILKAIKNAHDINMNIVNSAISRQILDRIVGFTASPFLMNNVGPHLSAGRVQSVVTRLVIQKEAEIESFLPEDYWTIQANLSKDNKQSFLTKYTGSIDFPLEANRVKEKLSKATKYIVSDVVACEEKRNPPAPLITSTLQQIMSRSFSMGADKTMKNAQNLYDQGIITYLRSDSTRTSDEALTEVRDWLTANNHNIPKKPNLYKNKDSVQDAHECIRPVDITLLPDNNMAIIDPDEKLVYKTVWNFFVASQCEPAVFNTLKVSAYPEGDKSIQVKVSGKSLKSKGFLEILGISDDSKIDIPNLVKGDELTLFGSNPVRCEKKQTQPPPRYSEDKLIKELVNKNIGRPSTYAELLTKITTRNYVEKIGNVYHATDLGKKVTTILTQFFTFMDYNYTAELEKKLDEIELGKLDKLDMLKEFYVKFKDQLDKAYLSFGAELCDKCGFPMSARIAKDGRKFLGCTNYPKCKNIIGIE